MEDMSSNIRDPNKSKVSAHVDLEDSRNSTSKRRNSDSFIEKKRKSKKEKKAKTREKELLQQN